MAYEITGSHLRCVGGRWGCRFVPSSAPSVDMNESLNPLLTPATAAKKRKTCCLRQTAHHNVAEADCDGYASLSGSHGEEQHWAPGAPPPQGLYLSAIVLYYSISARLPFISYSTVTSYDGLFDV